MKWRRAATALLIASLAHVSAADYLDSYRRGFHAFNLFRWESSATEMRKAIAENPRETAEKVHIGLLAWKPYVPHFYLGISLAKLGRCGEAVPALRESLRQGVLPDNYRRRAVSTLENCPAVQLEPGEPEPVEEPPVSTTEPAARDERETPLQLPAGESARPETVPQPSVPEQAPLQIEQVVPPGALRNTTAPAPSEAAGRIATSRDSLRAAMDRARELLRSVPQDDSAPQIAAVRERLRRIDPAKIDSAGQLLSATNDMTAVTAALEQWMRERARTSTAPAGPPRALIAAVDAYLRGRYADAIRTLDAAAFADERARTHAHLFRAAALHASFVIGKRRDKALYERALRDVRQFKQLRPGATLDRRLFSPAFLEVVEKQP